MDEIDNKIIAELRRDARMSYSALAATTGLSRVTVRARVERMVSSGAILGFTLTGSSVSSRACPPCRRSMRPMANGI